MKINITEMFVDDEMKDAATRILESKRYIKGPEVGKFENEFAEFIGAKSAVATSSGTTALFTAYMALGIKHGDEIIVPSHTFIATATPAVVLGAKIVFADIDPETYTLDPENVNNKITSKTKCIVPVHIYGHPVDMDPLIEIAAANDIPIIEDSCQAHGSTYKGKTTGSIGDMSCFSFFPSKNMTVAGDGGMITATNEEYGEKLRLIRDHGRTDKDTASILGLNFRMSEIHAALGRVQLKHLPEWIDGRRRAADSYNKLLQGIERVTRPIEKSWAKHVYHLYVIQLDDRDGLAGHLKSKEIGTGVHYPKPLHKQPVMEQFAKDLNLPVTESLVNRILSLPLYPDLKDEEIEIVTKEISNYLNK